MVASYAGVTEAGTGRVVETPADLLKSKADATSNCGPMTQQGMMGAHGHEMYPQGFLRLVGCHETGRQKHTAAPRLSV